jgi:hypothetical protein
MRKFLFDVYCGGEELKHVPGTNRIPVTIPEFKVRQPVEQPKEAEKPLPSVEYGPAPTPEPSLPPESAKPLESSFLTPELDFP